MRTDISLLMNSSLLDTLTLASSWSCLTSPGPMSLKMVLWGLSRSNSWRREGRRRGELRFLGAAPGERGDSGDKPWCSGMTPRRSYNQGEQARPLNEEEGAARRSRSS